MEEGLGLWIRNCVRMLAIFQDNRKARPVDFPIVDRYLLGLDDGGDDSLRSLEAIPEGSCRDLFTIPPDLILQVSKSPSNRCYRSEKLLDNRHRKVRLLTFSNSLEPR